MASYYQQKLMRIDEAILNLEYLYQRELLREEELGKHTLLLSRGMRYRLDNLYKAKTMLIKATGLTTSKLTNYKAVLSERTNAYEDAKKELEVLKTKQIEAGVNAHLHVSEYYVQEMRDLGKEIIRQEARIRNKKRALDNWIMKAGNVQVKNDVKIPRNYGAEEIAEDLVNSAGIQERYKEHLNSFPAKVENNATLDLLSSNPLFDSSGIMGETTTRRINTNINIEEQKDESVD